MRFGITGVRLLRYIHRSLWSRLWRDFVGMERTSSRSRLNGDDQDIAGLFVFGAGWRRRCLQRALRRHPVFDGGRVNQARLRF